MRPAIIGLGLTPMSLEPGGDASLLAGEAITLAAGGDRQVPNATTALVTGLGGRMDHHAVLLLDREAAS